VSTRLEIEGTSYEVADDTVRTLKEIAERNNVTIEAALKQAILNEKFIEEQRDSGAKLLIEKNGSLNEIVFEPARSAQS
jgi:hypothetical protein